MGLLEGKAAVVTGAGRGIGRGIAIALARAGAKVVVNDLGVSLAGEGVESGPADQVVAEITKAGGVALANYGSVTDAAQATAMVEQVITAWGHIDILVNVAGILRDRMIFNMTEAGSPPTRVMGCWRRSTRAWCCARSASTSARRRSPPRISSATPS